MALARHELIGGDGHCCGSAGVGGRRESAADIAAVLIGKPVQVVAAAAGHDLAHLLATLAQVAPGREGGADVIGGTQPQLVRDEAALPPDVLVSTFGRLGRQDRARAHRGRREREADPRPRLTAHGWLRPPANSLVSSAAAVSGLKVAVLTAFMAGTSAARPKRRMRTTARARDRWPLRGLKRTHGASVLSYVGLSRQSGKPRVGGVKIKDFRGRGCPRAIPG